MTNLVKVEMDSSKFSDYTGAVSGILDVIGSPSNRSRFITKYMNKTSDTFMTETIAANEAGSQNIRHMFEWGDHGTISDKPLFKIVKKGSGANRFLSFDFLPSTKPVPVIDAGRFDNTGWQFKPHIFRMKAMVMETMEHVTITPKNAKGLFIPAADQPRGYLIYPHSVTINPGGNSTGGFAKWWSEWFDTRAQELITAQTHLTEEFIAKTGQTIIRNLTTGQFTSAEKMNIGYADAVAREAEIQMQMALSMEYPNV